MRKGGRLGSQAGVFACKEGRLGSQAGVFACKGGGRDFQEGVFARGRGGRTFPGRGGGCGEGRWVSEFRQVAKRTLRTRPDLLAALGIS